MGEVIVTTTAGDVRGVEADGVASFKGVRYAAPPLGDLRFAPPAPVAAWDGVVDALAFGPSCPQAEARPDGWAGETATDEDCLFLNVFTPATGGGDRPVMVWFHGGGFAIGSGSWPLYDGANLARRDAVVVTVNHRLGIFGYLDLASLDDGAGDDAVVRSGNAGMLDLVAALEWVRDNIARFVGDPDNVCIFGESGGGAKVCTLLAMPAANGLFHRAVVQSGAGLYVQRPEATAATTEKVLGELGITEDPVRALRSLPVRELRRAQDAVAGGMAMGRMGLSPVLDGVDIAMHPSDALRSGAAPDVPIMVGTTFDEATLFLGREPALLDPDRLSMDDLPGRLAVFGDRVDGLLDAYRTSRPDATAVDLLIAIQTDAAMRMPSIKLAERAVGGGGAPVWMYLFCWAAGPLRSGHGFELPFVFDNIHDPVIHPSPSRRQLADRMAQAWVSFARDGDPNHDGLTDWPTYDPDARATMIFDRDECTVVEDPWAAERLAWKR